MQKEYLSDDVYALHPLFRVRLGPPIICDLLLEKRSVELSDSRYLVFLGSINQRENPREALVAYATSSFDVSWEEADGIVADLIANEILVPANREFPQLPGINHWVKRGWMDALLLHLSTRDLSFRDDQVDNPDEQNSEIMAQIAEGEGPPEFWKDYSGQPAFSLPEPENLWAETTVKDVLLRRRSNRPWRNGKLTQKQLSSILYAANIETTRLRLKAERNWQNNPEVLLNSSFCALETYLFAFDVEELSAGLYHYDPRSHNVVQLKPGLFRDELVKMCIGQSRPREAACAFVISAVWKRYMYRYRHPRAYRTLLINNAELAQKYILAATACNLSTFLTPALRDEYADSVLGLNGYDEAALYVVAVG